MEDILLPLLVTKSKLYFDLRGEMAATSTNKVSSLSQAHFDEILVLMEIAATQKRGYSYHILVLILVLMEIAAASWTFRVS